MRRILALVLALLMLGCLCGCGSDEDKSDQIIGQWETVVYYDSASIEELLVTMDFYEEEIALMDTSGVGFVDVVSLNEDGTYSMYCDVNRSVALAEEYYRTAMVKFYDSRDILDEVYSAGFTSMDQEGFFNFYAGMYGQESYDALIDLFVSCTVDRDVLNDTLENGTYVTEGNRIYFTTDGGTEAEYVSYAVDSNNLILSFDDGKIYYTRK